MSLGAGVGRRHLAEAPLCCPIHRVHSPGRGALAARGPDSIVERRPGVVFLYGSVQRKPPFEGTFDAVVDHAMV